MIQDRFSAGKTLQAASDQGSFFCQACFVLHMLCFSEKIVTCRLDKSANTGFIDIVFGF